jgi:hypothetical protein
MSDFTNTRNRRGLFDTLPDARDGLTRVERVVLYTLHELDQERPGRRYSTAEVYGRVCERIDISVDELQRVLVRMGAGDKRGRSDD